MTKPLSDCHHVRACYILASGEVVYECPICDQAWLVSASGEIRTIDGEELKRIKKG